MKNRQQLKDDLSEINNIIYKLGLEEKYEALIMPIGDMLEKDVYTVAIVGEFSSGKSTFINALLGEELLYSANKEATGTVTAIRPAPKPMVYIYADNEREIDRFSPKGKEGREKLNSYLDIKSGKKAAYVNIDYPIKGLGENVIFLDTPGIEKMSVKQLELTKKAIQESNAVLFLIKKEGFTAPGMDVIKGEHKIIGKIPTKNIFIVMTHIGEVYDDLKDAEAAEARVKSLLDNVRIELKDNGVENLPIFGVDSKEYLWSVNEDAYEREKELRQKNVRLRNKMLSKEAYAERSGFAAFKEVLFDSLDRSKNKDLLLSDVSDKIEILADALLEDIDGADKGGEEDKLGAYEKLISAAVSGQRRIYNNVIRNIRDELAGFAKTVERDCRDRITDKTIAQKEQQLVNEHFKTLDDIDAENIKYCIECVRGDTEKFSFRMDKATNDYINHIKTVSVPRLFKEEFKAAFGEKNISADFNANIDEYVTKLAEIREEYSADDDIQTMEARCEELENQIIDESGKLCELEAEYADLKKTAEQNLKWAEEWYENEKRKLGPRPKAEQKYKKVYKSSGMLFWKKEWYEDVPDGMDTSKGSQWDTNMKYLYDSYQSMSDRCLEDETEANECNKEIRDCRRKIDDLSGEKERLEQSIDMRKKEIQLAKEKFAEVYLARKKMEILGRCAAVRQDMLKQIYESVREYLYDVRRKLAEEAKSVIGKRISEYEARLKEKAEELKLQQMKDRSVYSESRDVLMKIKSIQIRSDEA